MTLARVRTSELLDRPDHDRKELADSLDQVARVDRLLGGERALRAHLAPVVEGLEGGRLLDVGTGNGRVLDRVVAWARSAGGPGWRGVGVDVHADVLAVASTRRTGDGGVTLVRSDALRLPFAADAFDAAFCTLTLHHFGEEAAVRVVAEMARVSRRIVLVNDLERSLPHYLGARLLALTWWRGNRLTRHDGPLSVLRSFREDELEAVGRKAGLQRPVVHRHFPFRLILEGRP